MIVSFMVAGPVSLVEHGSAKTGPPHQTHRAIGSASGSNGCARVPQPAVPRHQRGTSRSQKRCPWITSFVTSVLRSLIRERPSWNPSASLDMSASDVRPVLPQKKVKSEEPGTHLHWRAYTAALHVQSLLRARRRDAPLVRTGRTRRRFENHVPTGVSNCAEVWATQSNSDALDFLRTCQKHLQSGHSIRRSQVRILPGALLSLQTVGSRPRSPTSARSIFRSEGSRAPLLCDEGTARRKRTKHRASSSSLRRGARCVPVEWPREHSRQRRGRPAIDTGRDGSAVRPLSLLAPCDSVADNGDAACTWPTSGRGARSWTRSQTRDRAVPTATTRRARPLVAFPGACERAPT